MFMWDFIYLILFLDVANLMLFWQEGITSLLRLVLAVRKHLYRSCSRVGTEQLKWNVCQISALKKLSIEVQL